MMVIWCFLCDYHEESLVRDGCDGWMGITVVRRLEGRDMSSLTCALESECGFYLGATTAGDNEIWGEEMP